MTAEQGTGESTGESAEPTRQPQDREEEQRARAYRARRQQVPQTPIGRQITEYLSHLRIERGSSQNTLRSYENDLRRYGAHLLDCGITDPRHIEEGHISAFLRSLSTGEDGGAVLTARSAARVLASVRGLHRYWAAEGRTAADPAGQVSAPKPRQSLPKALSVEQTQALLDAPNPATPLGLRDRALLEFLYATGARVTEVVSLDVDDIHALTAPSEPGDSAGDGAPSGDRFVDGLVVVRVTGKGDKQRLVPVGSYAQRAVGDYLTAGRPALADAAARSSSAARRRGTPALFLNRLGSRMSRQSVWTTIQHHAQAAGITAEVSPHTLRHSCATHMLEGGAGIRMVQEMLGHSSVTTTQIYTKVTAEALQESYTLAHPRAR
ncbi:site-specific tyrosine recombinase XerD [Nesterenkonia aerolata]|uniref:Tyrosine recombinase XerC n=1 Tax=Nesterenkonia aerolata TaxID=3074079 RepID=A0ABU2DVG5_9MICC|nr:site-specific tyrosine recombinase XerD [Nesterenkonia sp. LY-0111]MDR8020260.1 site-specific tyrosine recombinase XerD [Nesterenkonia sp. LY-0111]